MNLFEPKTYSKKLGELISSVPFFPRGELIPGSKLIRDMRVLIIINVYTESDLGIPSQCVIPARGNCKPYNL